MTRSTDREAWKAPKNDVLSSSAIFVATSIARKEDIANKDKGKDHSDKLGLSFLSYLLTLYFLCLFISKKRRREGEETVNNEQEGYRTFEA